HISGVDNTQAPFWMRSRLVRIGQRSINLLVDLTNYVMFAVGQPTHIFNAEHVDLPIGVRRAHESEELVLLDDNAYRLAPSMLVVADSKRALALAGVMGGVSSAASSSTRDVILEIANFDAVTIRRAATRLSLRTEASARFEKALDTQRVEEAVDLFVALLRQIQPSATIVGFDDTHPRPTQSKQITVGIDFLQNRLGNRLSAEEMSTLLSRIGFDVAVHDDILQITVPTWRSTGDVSIPHDIVEEVARLYGYERFEFVPPTIQLKKPALNQQNVVERRIKEILAFTGGMQEVVTYPWVEDRLLTAAGMDSLETLRLSAPPAPDQSQLRPSLIPSLLKSVAINLRYFDTFGIFEAGRVFVKRDFRPLDSDMESLPHQRRHLGGALAGQDAEQLLLEAKGLIETVRRAAHISSLTFSRDPIAPWAEAGARLGLQADGEPAGALGVLTSRAKTLADIKRSQVVLFEIDLDILQPLASRENEFFKLSEFPEVESDLSLLFAEQTEWGSVVQEIQELHPLIKQIVFVDQFRGRGIPSGSKSITLRLRLGASSRTLTADDAKEVTNLVTEALKHKFGADLRS
ncbi:MAG: phenylalanine--tRNA ligase subunit beta, partial [Candidatus Tectomicrobia bacterium]|nr:phenylalanine--tRNA ligase subunit beta [Candidatus Tectomicrobia bacterium]